MSPNGSVPAGGTTLLQTNAPVMPSRAASTGSSAPISNVVPAGPPDHGGMTVGDHVPAATMVAKGSGQDLVPTHELAMDAASRLDTNAHLNLDQMKQLYPGMTLHTGAPVPPFMRGSEDLTPKHEGEALKIGNTLYIRYDHNLWKAPVKPDSIWLERMDENGVGVVHRTDKDIVKVGETATLPQIAKEKGVVSPLSCADVSAIDKNAREAAANIRGLDPNATWDDIKKFDANTKQAQMIATAQDRAARADAAKRVGLPFSEGVTWKDIFQREAQIEHQKVENAARAERKKLENEATFWGIQWLDQYSNAELRREIEYKQRQQLGSY